MVDLNIAADQAINEVVQLLIQDMGKTSINYKFSPTKKGEIDRSCCLSEFKFFKCNPIS